MSRFFTHLCLYLKMIDVASPPEAIQTILEAYLQVLEVCQAPFILCDASLNFVRQAQGQRELIALYASALGENAVERYAIFLTSLGLSADIDERKLALTRAKEYGLDIERVAMVTAERTLEKAFQVCTV